MEHNLQLFEHEEFGEVRVVIIDGEPWFVAADVCRILELDDVSKAVSRLDDDEKGTNLIPTRGGEQSMLIVNEPGLYRLIFSSRKPEAKKFQRWVTHEVLPSIRQTGSYNLPSVTDCNPLAQAISELVSVEREKLAVANSDETKTFAKAQLLRELVSASGDEKYVRSKLVRTAANLLMGDDFFKKFPDEDDEHICI